MRLTTSHSRRANRNPVPASKPRHPVVQAVGSVFDTLSGQRQRDAERAREQFERLDVDQRVRKTGEW